MGSNPYAATDVDEPAVRGFAVQGEYLMVALKKPDRLPDRCVFTNHATGRLNRVVYKVKADKSVTNHALRMIDCPLRFSVCTRLRWGVFLTTAAGALIIAGCLFGLVAFLGGARKVMAIGGAMVLLGVCLGWFQDVPQLRVVGFERGMFKVAGCCPEFLAELEKDLQQPA